MTHEAAEIVKLAEKLERQAARAVTYSLREWPHHREQTLRYAAECRQEAAALRARAILSEKGEQK